VNASSQELLAKIPVELRDQENWVTYRIRTEKGRETKPLYEGNGPQQTSVKKPKTWATAETAITTAERYGSCERRAAIQTPSRPLESGRLALEIRPSLPPRTVFLART